jgi:hypothetical protein
MAKPSMIDEIAASIPESQSGKPWWKKLTPQQQEFIKPILSAWKNGKFGKQRMPASKAIAAYLTKHGIEIGAQGVISWLQRN